MLAFSQIGKYDKKTAETKDVLGALVLADQWLMPDLFSHCEADLAKTVDESNVSEISDGVAEIPRAHVIKVKTHRLSSFMSVKITTRYCFQKACLEVQAALVKQAKE